MPASLLKNTSNRQLKLLRNSAHVSMSAGCFVQAASQGAPLRKPSLGAAPARSSPADRQRQNTGAAAARSRHVNLSPRGSGTLPLSGLGPAGQAAGSGRFQGFDT